jgi:hypothetical protein
VKQYQNDTSHVTNQVTRYQNDIAHATNQPSFCQPDKPPSRDSIASSSCPLKSPRDSVAHVPPKSFIIFLSSLFSSIG